MTTGFPIQWLVDRLAPHSPADFVMKFAGWTVFCCGFAVLIAGFLVGVGFMQSPQWVVETVVLAALVSMPIAVLILGLIGHLHQQQGKLNRLAHLDELTGLPNRRDFFRSIGSMRFKVRAAYLFLIDADHFKRINDLHGHAVGDQCLVAIAKRLRGLGLKNSAVARVGGEEFALLVPPDDNPAAVEIGRQICAELTVKAAVTGEAVTFTLSAGAVFLTAAQNFDRAMIVADKALYQAKAAGRAQAVILNDLDADLPEVILDPSKAGPRRARGQR